MSTITIQIEDSNLKLITELVKKLGGKVLNKETKVPNEETIEAIKEARAGKGTLVRNKKELDTFLLKI